MVLAGAGRTIPVGFGASSWMGGANELNASKASASSSGLDELKFGFAGTARYGQSNTIQVVCAKHVI